MIVPIGNDLPAEAAVEAEAGRETEGLETTEETGRNEGEMLRDKSLFTLGPNEALSLIHI